MASALHGQGSPTASGSRRLAAAPARRVRSFGRLAGRARSRPLSLRLPIPVELLRRMELGLDLAAAGQDPTGWWGRVEDRMHRFVRSRLPPGARDLRLTLDDEALEVVAEFECRDPE